MIRRPALRIPLVGRRVAENPNPQHSAKSGDSLSVGAEAGCPTGPLGAPDLVPGHSSGGQEPAAIGLVAFVATRLPVRGLALGAALLVVAISVSPTAAADGSYLRIGVGLERPAQARFLDADCASESPTALYGCGLGKDGAPLSARGDFGIIPAFELAWGHAAAAAVRLEFAIEYRPRERFSGIANFLEAGRRQSVDADLSSYAGLASMYLDLARVGIAGSGSVHPFVGVGIGIGLNTLGQMSQTFPRTSTLIPGSTSTGRVWMVTAGLAMPLSEAAFLDVAWRYADRGAVETSRGEGKVIWRDGSRDPLLLDLAPTQANLRGSGLRISLRCRL